ncbi:acyl-[acyl-carrier-protein] thioesterase, partial [Clostridium polynesiense]|uniref:acyl-[acyl-carrier-protein] thioesterase n=1 Tax=Clostridium polynesiense TaxID=1325933 RepID=UPI000590DF71
MNKNSFVKEYEVRYYEVDYKQRLLPTALLNYFGDMAMAHSEKCGVGLEYLKEKNLAWVLYKYDIEIFKYGILNEKIKITTEAYGFKKFYAYRNFYAENSRGEKIAEGKAVFLLINYERRRPVRIPEDFYAAYGAEGDIKEEIKLYKLQRLTDAAEERTFTVRYTDIDTNTHVNNVKYLDWLIEAVPLNIVKNSFLKNIKIDYLKECFYGDTIKSKAEIFNEENSTKIIHKIVNQEDKEITLAETYWVKKNE